MPSQRQAEGVNVSDTSNDQEVPATKSSSRGGRRALIAGGCVLALGAAAIGGATPGGGSGGGEYGADDEWNEKEEAQYSAQHAAQQRCVGANRRLLFVVHPATWGFQISTLAPAPAPSLLFGFAFLLQATTCSRIWINNLSKFSSL
jgi:hypothetical protein